MKKTKKTKIDEMAVNEILSDLVIHNPSPELAKKIFEWNIRWKKLAEDSTRLLKIVQNKLRELEESNENK